MIIHKSNSLLYSGHMYGSYMSNESTDYAYIPIPKNASSYLKYFFEFGWDWKYNFNYYENSNKKFLVLLRDPVSRWLAGVVEYFYREHPNMVIKGETFLNFIFERIVFDEHNFPQVNFLHGLESEKLIIFKFDDNIDSNIEKFVTSSFNDPSWSTRKLTLIFDKNESAQVKIKKTNIDILKLHLKTNPKYLHALKEFYKEDYNLINSVNYYGT